MSREFTAGGTPLPPASDLCADPKLRKRFAGKVKPGVGEFADCQEWQGDLLHNGYGKFYARGLTLRAHRVAWMLEHGEWPDSEKMLLHSCHNRRCVNPDHLREGTAAENQADVQERRRNGRDHWRGGRCPEVCLRGGSKLSPHQVKAIRERLAGQKVIEEIEAAMVSLEETDGSVTTGTVRRIARKKSWGWL